MKKTIFIIFTLMALALAFAELPCEYSTRLKAKADPAITAMTLARTNTFASGTAASSSEVNTNFSEDLTEINRIVTDLGVFAAGLATLADAETITGAWTYNAGIAFESGDGINDTFLLIDANETGAAVDTSVRFQRGTDGADSQILYDESDEDFEFHRDQSATLAQIVFADGSTGNDGVTYQQVVLDTGAQTAAGAKTWSDAATFSSTIAVTGASTLTGLVSLGTECTGAGHGCTKAYIDNADSAITAGGCSEGVGAPVGACMAGACYYDTTLNTAPIGYFCEGADGTTWAKVGQDSILATNPIFTSTDVDFTGAPAASTTDSLIGLGADLVGGDASGTYIGINAAMGYAGNLLDFQVNGSSVFKIDEAGIATGITPTASAHLATKGYVDAATISLYGDGSDGAVTISMATTLTSDMYYSTLTVDAGQTLTTNGYAVFCSTECIFNGTLDLGTGAAGGAGAAGSSGNGGAGGTAGTNTRATLAVVNGVTGGAGGANGGSGTGTAGTAGTAGNSITYVQSSGGAGAAGAAGGAGAGGSGGGGGAAGAAGSTTRTQKLLNPIYASILPITDGVFARGGSGASGGGGGCGGDAACDAGGGGGGGSGANGQTGYVAGKTITWGGSSTLSGIGGAGGAGGAGQSSGARGGGGGGGGSGGGGSLAIFVYHTLSGSPNTTTLTAGAAGAAGAGGTGSSSNGTAGTIGNAGSAGIHLDIAI